MAGLCCVEQQASPAAVAVNTSRTAALPHWPAQSDTLVLEGYVQEGQRYTVKVVRLADFGAFVEFSSGVRSLLHISGAGNVAPRAQPKGMCVL